MSFGRVVSESDSSSWAWHIAAARNDHEQNLSANRASDGMIVFKTTRRVLKGEELRVWLSSDLAKHMGVPAHVGTFQGIFLFSLIFSTFKKKYYYLIILYCISKSTLSFFVSFSPNPSPSIVRISKRKSIPMLVVCRCYVEWCSTWYVRSSFNPRVKGSNLSLAQMSRHLIHICHSPAMCK